LTASHGWLDSDFFNRGKPKSALQESGAIGAKFIRFGQLDSVLGSFRPKMPHRIMQWTSKPRRPNDHIIMAIFARPWCQPVWLYSNTHLWMNWDCDESLAKLV
jgi:hypothetical protein